MLRKYAPHLHASLLVYWACLGSAFFAFAGLASEVREGEGFAFDAPILRFLADQQGAFLVGAAHFLSRAFAPLSLSLVTLALVLFFAARRLAGGLFLCLSLGGAMLLNVLLKLFFARLRPDLADQLSPAPGFSFPSGHAMGSSAFFLALFLIVSRTWPRQRVWVATLGAVLTLLVGLSRLELQVHYPSDVLAGWALSVAWVLGVNLWYARTHR